MSHLLCALVSPPARRRRRDRLSPLRADTDPTSSDSFAVSLHWHQWRNLLLSGEKGVLSVMPGGNMFPVTLAMDMSEDRDFCWQGTKVSYSF